LNVPEGDMAKVTVTEAAKLAGIARQHFYRAYINTGKISVDREDNGRPLVETSELIRVFGELKASHHGDKKRHEENQKNDNTDGELQGNPDQKDEIIALLQQQVDELKAREKDLVEKAEAREAWLRQQLERAQAVLTDQRTTEKRRWWQFWG
jgi:hypothetical protein